jgi:carboxypeptidase family protein
MTEDRHASSGRRWIAILALVLAVTVLGFLVDHLTPRTIPPDGGADRVSSRSAAVKSDTPEAESPLDPGLVSVEVRGFIIADRTGNPIPGARVTVQIGEDVREARTDSAGMWGIVVPVPAATRRGIAVRLEADADGWMPAHWKERIGRDRPVRHVRAVALKPVAAWISGRVVDPEGAPIPGASGRVGRTQFEAGVDGRFRPVPVAAGSVVVRAGAFGWLDGTERLLVLPGSPPGKREADLILHPADWVEGLVVDETGRVIPGASIRRPYKDPVLAVTDAKGRFRLPVRAIGYAEVHVSAQGHVPDPTADMVPVVQRIGDNRIVLYRTVPVTGRVLLANGLPLVDAQVDVFRAGRGRTGADGSFRIDAVPLGSVKLEVSRHGLDLATFQVDVPTSEEGLTLRLPPLRSVPVIVLDEETGEPVPGTTMAMELEGAEFPAVADASGRIELLIPEGEKLRSCISLTYPGESWTHSHLKEPSPGEPIVFRRPPIRLLPAKVRVVTHTGDPVAGAVVTVQTQNAEVATAATGADGVAEFDTPAGEAPLLVQGEHPTLGFGTVRVPPGDGSVDVEVVLQEPSGLVSIVVLGDDDAPLTDAYSMLLRRIDLADHEGTIRLPLWMEKEPPVIGAPGHVSRKLDKPPAPGDPARTVVLMREALIRGVVVDARGRPFPLVTVRIDEDEGPESMSDARGRFALGGFVRGQAEVLVFKMPAFPFLPGPWGVAGGEDVRIVVPDRATVVFRAPPELLAVADTDREEFGDMILPGMRHEWSDEPSWSFMNEARRGSDWVVELPAGRAILACRFGGLVARADLMLEAGHETVVHLMPESRSSLTGRVLAPSGCPVVDASVRSLPFLLDFGRTGKDGRFEYANEECCVPPIPLLVLADGYAPCVTERVDLGAAQDLTVRLTHGGTLRIRVVGDGAPAAGCTVVPFGHLDRHLEWGETDERGVAVLEHLPAGSRLVLVRRGKELPVRRTIRIEDGKTTELTVTLPDR